jgi:hypothetical protein
VGVAMGYYFIIVLRPLFVLTPPDSLPSAAIRADGHSHSGRV